MSKKLLLAGIVLVGLAGLALIGASMDFAGDLVVGEARKATRELLDADLSVGSIRGNPIRGFSLGEVALAKNGQNLFSARFLDVSIDFASLLSRTPKLKLLSFGGVAIDADRLAQQVAALEFEGGGDGEIPVETVRFVESVVTSRWARAEVAKLDLTFKENEIVSDVDLSINSIPVRGRVTAALGGERVEIRSLAMKAGRGSIEASGRVAPSLNVAGRVEGVDLQEILSFWPIVPPDGFDGAFSLSFRGEGEWNAPRLRGDFDYKGRSILGYPVESVNASWGLGLDRLAVENLEARVLGMPLSGGMSLAFGAGTPPVVDLSLSGSGIRLAELKAIYPDLGDLSGTIDNFVIKLAGSAETLSGVVEFSAPELGLLGYSVSESRAQIKLTPAAATLSAKSQFEGAPITAQGSIADYMTEPKLNLTANIRNLNLARGAAHLPQLRELALQGAVHADAAIRGTAAAPEVSVKVWSEKISAMRELLESPSVTVAMKGERVRIENASARWRGASLAASGTVDGGERLNLTATVENLQPGAIAPFYPDIAQFKITGAVNAKAALSGNIAAPKIDLTLSSANLGLMDAISFRNVQATTTLAGDPAALAKADLELGISAAAGSVEGFGFSDLALKLQKRGQTVSILSAGAKSGAGSLAASGSVALPAKAGESGNLDIGLTVSKADLAVLAGGMGVAVTGIVDGTATVKGAFENPSLSVKATAPRVGVAGMTATDLSLALSGSAADMRIDDFKARFGGGTLAATGSIKPGEVPDVTLDLSGSDLDLAALVSGMPDAAELGISGRVNVSFKGRFAGAAGKGQGIVTSPAFSVMGLKGTNLSYPLALDGHSLSSRGASVAFYGGSLRGGGTLDIDTMKFSHSAEIDGVDVNAVVQDFTGGLEGRITGVAKGSANISGALEPKLSYSGRGSITIGEGSIAGFRGVQVLTALYRTGVRYANVTAPFRLETGRFILEQGARANAPQNDPLYRFLTAEGPIGPDGALNLQCAGNVNLQVLTALTGGAVGGLTARSLQDALRGIVGGLQTGMEQADFRDISFTLRGTTERPGVSNLNIARAPGEEELAPAQPAPAEQPLAPQQPPKTPEQILLEQIIQPPQPAQPGQPAPEKKPEDVIRDKLIESIFRR